MSRAKHVMGWCFPWIFRRPRKKRNQRGGGGDKKKKGRGKTNETKQEKSQPGMGLVWPEPGRTGLPQAPLARILDSGLRQEQAKFLDFHSSFGFEFGPKKKKKQQKGKRKKNEKEKQKILSDHPGGRKEQNNGNRTEWGGNQRGRIEQLKKPTANQTVRQLE